MPVSGDSTTTISNRYEFNAPAEVVYGVLTDPDRTTRWLPLGMRAEPAGDGRVRVRHGDRTFEYEVSTHPDELELLWRSPGLAGSARVEDAPAGGSVVRVEVTVPAAEQRPAEDLLAETMRHLARDVSDNFNAG